MSIRKFRECYVQEWHAAIVYNPKRVLLPYLSCKILTSPSKSTQVSLHFWQAWRGERIMFDNVIDSWILQAQTSTCLLVFSYLESLKNLKKSPGWSFFYQFSRLRLKKYKIYHRRTLLTSKEEKAYLFRT